ncbi:cytochrome b [Mesorhizobium humile]|uniref:Cytochrome b/b6 domain-containing protein n=1 Tax=Mesorhizobium humile TaxID=3072313 RepID=A0ABU4YF36_9HYPH|nr:MULTISPECIES: cytochrome b/b6 domain-containing protein [unclassified Mesorhizobium]MDX8460565.1 cytochrome b/b6 domain-containing protein [Mesorhizobium sp. VK2D]MDX8485346.1 cytochrome b/b6 domain-containing protein [Mesorhizobium sp. VK2B]
MRRYTQITIAIHWLTAVLVVIAWFTAVGGRHARTDPSYVHFTVGLAVLVLVVPRLLARWLGAAPHVEDPQSRWMDLAARAGHTLLYLFLIALPLSGWYAASRLGLPVSFLGLDLPALATPVQGAPGQIADLHETGGTLILWLAGAHALVAIWHQFILKDGTLERMNPLASSDLADSRE